VSGQGGVPLVSHLSPILFNIIDFPSVIMIFAFGDVTNSFVTSILLYFNSLSVSDALIVF
jgi:hypothetical protein